MKFSCDRCGKKYATAEAPAPGRVYKLKCKACGHVIVVKTPAAGPAVTPAPGPADEPFASRASSGSLPAIQPPEVEVAAEPPVAAATPPPEMPGGTPVPSRAAEPTAEISMMAEVTAPKPPESGYVDLFADAASPPPPPPAVPDDPFLKAARGSLPEHFQGADPFADMRDELDAAPSREPEPAPASRPVPSAASFAPPPARVDEKKKSGLPIALIGVGVAAVLGIVVVVTVTSGKKAAPPSERPAPAPVAAPAPPPQPPPVAAPPQPPEPKKVEVAKAEPKPEPRVEPKIDKKADAARAEEERKRAEARAEADRKRAEAKAEEERKRAETRAEAERKRAEAKAEADRKRAEAKAEEERKRLAKAEAAKPADKPVQLPDAATALSPEAVQKVVNASRRAFEACIADAAKRGTDTKFDGRKVALRLNVNPNGFVTYPTLDDVTLNRTDLGECLKSAARLMVFPKFQGDVFHVEVPLTLRGG